MEWRYGYGNKSGFLLTLASTHKREFVKHDFEKQFVITDCLNVNDTDMYRLFYLNLILNLTLSLDKSFVMRVFTLWFYYCELLQIYS